MHYNEALEKSIRLWKWLAENPDKSKRMAYKALGLQEDIAKCPLCDYAHRATVAESDIETANKGYCHNCLLKGRWLPKRFSKDKREGSTCMTHGSPYRQWLAGEDIVAYRAKAALKMIALFESTPLRQDANTLRKALLLAASSMIANDCMTERVAEVIDGALYPK